MCRHLEIRSDSRRLVLPGRGEWSVIRVRNGKGCGGTFPERRRNLKLAVKLEVALARNFTVVFCPRAGILSIFIRKILMDISFQYFSSSGHAMKKGELLPQSFHNMTHFQERTKQGLSPPQHQSLPKVHTKAWTLITYAAHSNVEEMIFANAAAVMPHMLKSVTSCLFFEDLQGLCCRFWQHMVTVVLQVSEDRCIAFRL